MNIVCAAVRTKALYEKKDKEIIISTLTVNVCYDKITLAAVNVIKQQIVFLLKTNCKKKKKVVDKLRVM